MKVIGAILLIVLGLIVIKFGSKNVEENFWDRLRRKIYTEKYYQYGIKFEKWVIGLLLICFGLGLLK